MADHWACRLREEGYEAEAPYNGAVWIVGRRAACAELGNTRKIVKTPGVATVRRSAAYDRLVNMGKRLMVVIQHNQGGANKDPAKFASQIASLCDNGTADARCAFFIFRSKEGTHALWHPIKHYKTIHHHQDAGHAVLFPLWAVLAGADP